MNWSAELCALYDKIAESEAAPKGDEAGLLPLYHTSTAAQITVTIDDRGNFLDAEPVPEDEKTTVIPVTEKSAGRTSGKESHPLCDNLEYLAGDDPLYAGEKDCASKHGLYMEQLRQWADSPYTHPKVQAIREYMEKSCLIGDLREKGIFTLEEDGGISGKAKIQAAAQTKAFVRFRVVALGLSGEESLSEDGGAAVPECWKDKSLQQCYVDYCRSQERAVDLSYLTGRRVPVTYYHPRKIRHEGDSAKLISANDSEYFTFRGRFATKEEAFSVGYEDSQKMHNALKWIIRKQGKNCGDLCIVTWDSALGTSLDWMEDTEEIGRQAMEEQAEDNWEEDGWAEEDWESEESSEADTGELAAFRFRRALDGYCRHVNKIGNTNTVIMAFDAATPGRLSMVEYKEYSTSRYVQNIKSWYGRCEWEHQKANKERGRYAFRGMVGIRDAAELLYGTESKGFLTMAKKENLYKEVVRKLMPCILDGKPVPRDMVNQAVHRASSPQSFEDSFLWERVLTFACSLVKQDRGAKMRSFGIDAGNGVVEEKEEYSMSLDVNCRKRDYLYGRLLALADRVEYRTYNRDDNKDEQDENKGGGSRRQTNAKRYMSAFSQHPFRTWKILEEKLEPYFAQLKTGECLYYRNIMDEIFELFDIGSYEDDSALNGVYLIGYHNQAYAMRVKPKNI